MNDQFGNLLLYIHGQIDQGVPSAQIYNSLLQVGWATHTIEKAYGQLGLPTPAYAPPIARQPSQAQQRMAYMPQNQATPSATSQQPAADQYARPAAPQQPQQPQEPATTSAPPSADLLDSAMGIKQKYRVFRAIGDYFKAVRRNALGYILTLIVTNAFILLSSAGFAYLLAETWKKVDSSSVDFTTQLASMAAALLIPLVIIVLANVLAFNAAAVSLREGAWGRRQKLRHTLGRSFRRIFRVPAATILAAVVSFLPAVLAGIGLGVADMFFRNDKTASFVVLIIGVCSALVLSVLLMMRYALVPYVALFEPEIRLSKTLKRSRQLMRKGGYWFLAKGYLLYLFLSLLIGVASGIRDENDIQSVRLPVAIGAAIASALVSLVASGVMVMLYHNRQAVRG